MKNIPNEYSGKAWDILRELYATHEAPDLSGVVHSLEIAGVPQETGLILHRLIRKYRPKRTLETGFAFGFSTLFILQALEENGEGVHMAIDPVESTRWHGIGLANVARSGLEGRFELLEIPSQLALPSLLSNSATVDFAFVDGSHVFDETLLDAYYLDRMLPVGGLLVFDDWGWMPAVRAAVNFVETNLAYEPEVQESRTNIRVLRKIAKPPRSWDHFVPFAVPSRETLAADRSA